MIERDLRFLPSCLRPALRRLAAVLFALAVSGMITLTAQTGAAPPAATGGAITGHVRGPGGVPVPGATVLLVEKQTGRRKETWTDENGDYTLTAVPPGVYKLEVSLVGFESDVREPVPVAPGKPLKVNIVLVLPQPQIPAEAQNGAQRGMPNLANLPPEVRARIQARLQSMGNRGADTGLEGDLGGANGGTNGGASGGEGGVRFSDNATNGGGNEASGEARAMSADNGASAANSFLLSGGVSDAPTPGGDQGRMGRMRQVFQLYQQMQGGAPGFGGAGGPGGGLVVSGPRGGGPGGGGFGGGGFGGGPMIMFSGRGGPGRPRVNRLRGNIWESYSNSALDARPYALNGTESPQIASYSENFGVSVGGPLVIPKIYNGADKTSFFVNYSLGRSKSPFDSYATVPTAAERGGDFSGAGATLYDPLSNPLGPRAPFLDNQIPAERMSLAAVGLLKYVPLPNLPGAVENFHLQESLPSHSDRVMGRIGHTISSKDNLNAFYFFNSVRSTSVSSFPALTSSLAVRSQNLNLGESHNFSPHLINNFNFNFNRQRSSTLNPFAYTQNIAGELGIAGIATDPRDWGLPSISFTNFSGLNDTLPSLTRNQTVRAVDFLLLDRGRHNVRMGGEVRRVELNTFTDPNADGTFTFSGYTTSNFTAAGQPVSGTGFDFADFLLGLPQITSVRYGSSNYFRSWVYDGFLQDDWRVNSHFTFNGGLRYEHFTPFSEVYGRLSDLAIGPGFSSVGVVTGQNPDGLPPSLVRHGENSLAPRIGIAYRPWANHHWVLRAGYGLFYDSSIYQRLVPNLANQPPFAQASTLITSPQQTLTLQNGFPQVSPNVLTNTYAVDPSFRTPYGQTWNFTLEEEIARDTVLDVGYVGTKGTHLDLLLGPNRAPSSGTGGVGSIPNAQQFTYETSGADSIYNALQVSLRRMFHGGLSLWAEYMYSKSIDDASSIGGTSGVVAQDYLDLGAERGLSSFDMRHRFSLNYQVQFPFGDRRRFLNKGGALARVLGNWQISGNSQIQSGMPYTALVRGNLGATAGNGAYQSERANATGEPVSLVNPTAIEFFNAAAFTVPAAGEFGNAGRDTIPGPGRVNFNMALDRFVTVSQEKGMRLDFRVQASNAFNTVNYTGLATVVNSTNFGRITSAGSMRTLTASLRFRF